MGWLVDEYKKCKPLVAGSIAGCVPAVLLHPLDVVKTRYQANDSNISAYRSFRHSFVDIARAEGARALFQGLGTSLLGNCVANGLYFNFYERSKNRRKMEAGGSGHLSPDQNLLAGAEAGYDTLTAFVA